MKSIREGEGGFASGVGTNSGVDEVSRWLERYKELSRGRSGGRDSGRALVKLRGKAVMDLAFDPSQPRDEQGRWTDEGGAASSGNGQGSDSTVNRDKALKSHQAEIDHGKAGTAAPSASAAEKSGTRPATEPSKGQPKGPERGGTISKGTRPSDSQMKKPAPAAVSNQPTTTQPAPVPPPPEGALRRAWEIVWRAVWGGVQEAAPTAGVSEMAGLTELGPGLAQVIAGHTMEDMRNEAVANDRDPESVENDPHYVRLKVLYSGKESLTPEQLKIFQDTWKPK